MIFINKNIFFSKYYEKNDYFIFINANSNERTKIIDECFRWEQWSKSIKNETNIENSDFKLELTIDSVFKLKRFAILDKNNNPLWYGKDFDSNLSESSELDFDLGRKAIWVAEQIKNQQGLENMVLVLKTDYEFFKFNIKHELEQACNSKNIGLIVEHMDLDEINSNPISDFLWSNSFAEFNEQKDYVDLLEKTIIKMLNLIKKMKNQNQKTKKDKF